MLVGAFGAVVVVYLCTHCRPMFWTLAAIAVGSALLGAMRAGWTATVAICVGRATKRAGISPMTSASQSNTQ